MTFYLLQFSLGFWIFTVLYPIYRSYCWYNSILTATASYFLWCCCQRHQQLCGQVIENVKFFAQRRRHHRSWLWIRMVRKKTKEYFSVRGRGLWDENFLHMPHSIDVESRKLSVHLDTWCFNHANHWTGCTGSLCRVER